MRNIKVGLDILMASCWLILALVALITVGMLRHPGRVGLVGFGQVVDMLALLNSQHLGKYCLCGMSPGLYKHIIIPAS